MQKFVPLFHCRDNKISPGNIYIYRTIFRFPWLLFLLLTIKIYLFDAVKFVATAFLI